LIKFYESDAETFCHSFDKPLWVGISEDKLAGLSDPLFSRLPCCYDAVDQTVGSIFLPQCFLKVTIAFCQKRGF